MAHFARVDNSIVVDVHVVNNNMLINSNGLEDEQLGKSFLSELHGYPAEQYIQCSYNNKIRNIYPGIGFWYDKNLDIFMPPKPGDGYVLDESTYSWILPES